MPGPAVELPVKRHDLGDDTIAERHHLGDGHAVVGDLERKEVVEAHGLGHLVPDVAEPQKPVAERTADRLGSLPGGVALGKIARLDQHLVDVVGCRGRVFAVAAESKRKPILDGALLGLGLRASLDDLGYGARRLGGGEPDLLELADLLVGDFVLAAQQIADRVNDAGAPTYRFNSRFLATWRAVCASLTSVDATQSASEDAVSSGNQPSTNSLKNWRARCSAVGSSEEPPAKSVALKGIVIAPAPAASEPRKKSRRSNSGCESDTENLL